jgi:EAL domain-containing protein (putative c-di-GMP-specific phosphodiesterase class I)
VKQSRAAHTRGPLFFRSGFTLAALQSSRIAQANVVIEITERVSIVDYERFSRPFVTTPRRASPSRSTISALGTAASSR